MTRKKFIVLMKQLNPEDFVDWEDYCKQPLEEVIGNLLLYCFLARVPLPSTSENEAVETLRTQLQSLFECGQFDFEENGQ